MTYDDKEKDLNRDPITGEPGAHPVGVGIGTAVGAAGGAAVGAVATGAVAGAAAGTAAGPIGTAAGAVIGGIAGAAMGKGLAEAINPTEEEEYWQENYTSRPYVASGEEYEIYRPAYRYGVDSYTSYEGRTFDEIEPELNRNWNSARGASTLEWDRARPAVQDSYNRLYDRQRSKRSVYQEESV